MSTRCMIKLRDDRYELTLYHHHDGYPEGVGSDLVSRFYKRVTDLNCSLWLSTVANELLKDNKDKEYEVTFGVHTDIEYLYEIDLAKATITCKAVHYDCETEDFIVDEVYNLLDYICLFDTKNMIKTYELVDEEGTHGQIVFDMVVGKKLYENTILSAFRRIKEDYQCPDLSVKEYPKKNLKSLHVTINLPKDKVNEIADTLIQWFDVNSR